MVKVLGVIFGIAFLLGGALGFVSGVTQDGMYFGIFMVNTPHNILHVVSGATFLVAAAAGAGFVRLWFQIFGASYAAIATIGFWVGDGMICGFISNNRYDAWGHTGLALAMLLIGFGTSKRAAAGQPAVTGG
jgi:hypothetical protein